MANIFINAAKARENTRDNTATHSEIRLLETAVLGSIANGVLSVKVSSNTLMTTDVDYYKAYYGITENRALLDQIDFVVKYFKDLGYSIKITGNELTGNTLVWNIAW